MPNVQTGGRSSIAWALLGLKGRISRRTYWLATVLVICLNGVVIGQLLGGEEATLYRVANAIGPFVILATIYSNVAVTVKRLHDVGYSGYMAVAMFVPFINIVFTIWIGIVPGKAGPNAYGDVTDRVPA